MKCAECNHENPTAARFCMECGAKLGLVCMFPPSDWGRSSSAGKIMGTTCNCQSKSSMAETGQDDIVRLRMKGIHDILPTDSMQE